MTIGFIGQGYIGKNYADDFEKRGFSIVRYALEEPHISNKDRIKECDIVFIAVPTPTTPSGFDINHIESVLPLIGKGKIAVIKSTLIPGATKQLQIKFPEIIILISPEFLSESTAAKDAAHPFSNIVGMPVEDSTHVTAAKSVHEVLPSAPYSTTVSSDQAELIKVAHNGSGYVEIVFFNLMYDLSQSLNADWEPIKKALQVDPFIANRYAEPVHKSGRGAAGHCFLKDFEALRDAYNKRVKDTLGMEVFSALVRKNNSLLRESGKDLDLLKGVYGPEVDAE